MIVDFLPIVSGILALCFMFYQIKFSILTVNEGTDRMRQIARHIRTGAMAFIRREYTYIIIFVVVVFLLISIFINLATAICFVIGALFSMLAGYIGMRISTSSNARCANAAREKGISQALKVAFSGGSVMGMAVTGLGFLGIGIAYLIYKNPTIVVGYSFGASSVALFARVGGGIYTKAADVGADLVGKVEAGIPEDDPRNPAVIADNVGDNVGDVAGMGADLFESYVGAIISSMILGSVAFQEAGIRYPLLLVAVGIIASIVTSYLFVNSNHKNPQSSLMNAVYMTGAIEVVVAIVFSFIYFKSVNAAVAVIVGIVCGLIIGFLSELFTSDGYSFVKNIAKESETGSATNIISGLSTGMLSTVLPIVFICIGIIVSFALVGIYGIALAAVGMLSITSITVTVDAYGPIADNAGGIAEMSGLDPKVRETTDKLDSVGNTTAAIGKGFAIGSAALTALSLFVTYADSLKLESISILQPKVVAGLFFGGMLTFLFAALTMSSVGKAAFSMIEEVRKQFREIPGIMEGKAEPDYARCIEISTTASLKEMIVPGVIAVVVPVFIGKVFGAETLGGMLAGSLVTGVLMAIFMANAGGAWDNAKKYIESGKHGGKNSMAHKAAVVGDTVGDPFKDTSGPALNILIKLMTVVSVVCAGLFI